MPIRRRWMAASVCASLTLGGCGTDPVGPTRTEADPNTVQLSIVAVPSQVYETCREIRVEVTALRGKRPVRGLVVNFVPLAGSVFAAAVATNKDGVATTYWNLGRVFDQSRLLARAVDEDGARVLDDTLAVETRQRPTQLQELWQGLTSSAPSAPREYRLESRVRLVDGCGDPIPGALLSVRYSGPGTPLDPVEITMPTFPFEAPTELWGLGIMSYRFTSLPPGVHEVTWRAVDVPELVLPLYWHIQ